MTDSERRHRPAVPGPRLTADEVASRAFGSAFRGYSEPEVRAFLRRVAEELEAATRRERELGGAIDDLERRLREPAPLDEGQLLDALGEETARLLRTAREAAADIRGKAEERAGTLLREAQEEARRLRQEAEAAATEREQEATRRTEALVASAEADLAQRRADHETAAATLRAEADEYAAEQRRLADDGRDAELESARARGREMLDEAKGVRERVLGDLQRRRALLHGQIEELRRGRDTLLDAYRVVKRTFLDATEALAQVEHRLPPTRPLEPSELELAEGEGEVAVADADEALAEGDRGAEVDGAVPVQSGPLETVAGGPVEDRAGGPVDAEAPAATLDEVDSLFARIRAGQEVPPPPAAGVAVPETSDHQTSGDETAAEVVAPAATGAVDVDAGPDGGGGAEAATPDAEESLSPAEAWAARGAGAVEALRAALSKRAKRTAQDEQNALLDAVRRAKGRPSAAKVLPSESEAIEGWARVLHDALASAYSDGRRAAGDGDAGEISEAVVRESAATLVGPLHERLTAVIDGSDTGDDDLSSELSDRIGARYREWKTETLDAALGDALVAAWARGVFDGTPDGSLLRWIPPAGGCCPDCADNALEPTVKAGPFPTGALHPPVHGGCRCVLAPDAALREVAAVS